MNLTVTQKTQILDKIEQYIETRFYNPLAELPAWKIDLDRRRTTRIGDLQWPFT